MSYYESMNDRLCEDTAHGGDLLTDADLAEEEADSTETHGAPLALGTALCSGRASLLACAAESSDVTPGLNAQGRPKGSGFEPPAMSLPEIGPTERLVSLHYGHGGLAAGGRKRVNA